jgi:hypothetical protein
MENTCKIIKIRLKMHQGKLKELKNALGSIHRKLGSIARKLGSIPGLGSIAKSWDRS